MADVIDELLQSGSVDPSALAEILRRQSEHGLVGSLSGSKRLAPVAADMRAGALDTAAGIGTRRDAEALARWKQQMALLGKRADLESRASEGRLNRQSRLDVQGMRGAQAADLARLKAKLKGAGGSDPNSAATFNVQADDMERLAGIAEKAIKQSNRLSTGPLAHTRFIGGSPARNLWELTEPLRSSEALTKLQELRAQAQAVGAKGSGLGQVTEREIALLINSYASLETLQSEEQFDSALRDIAARQRRIAKNFRLMAKELGAGAADDESGDADLDSILRESLGDEMDGFNDDSPY